jgi:hypothetical protein
MNDVEREKISDIGEVVVCEVLGEELTKDWRK